jgi:hypothetical protein
MSPQVEIVVVIVTERVMQNEAGGGLQVGSQGGRRLFVGGVHLYNNPAPRVGRCLPVR